MHRAHKWVAVDFGGPEALRRVDVEVHAPQPGQVAIEIRAAGMNPADAKHIAPGQDRKLLPLDLGYEVAGVVTEVGAGSEPSPVSVGDEPASGRETGTGEREQLAVAQLIPGQVRRDRTGRRDETPTSRAVPAAGPSGPELSPDTSSA